jgi:Reverse transcriptase (RNA-dependent DNA polymerase).
MTVKEAKERTDWDKWKIGMDDEINQLEGLKTWTLVHLPTDRTAIPNKWVYRLKKDKEGIIIKHKARLVAKGYEQQAGIDYGETFAPVMRLDTLRLLLALAAKLALEIHVVDIVGAYLNGKLDEIIYMQQPPEYNDGTGRVCQLHRSIYGLKQSGRVWNDNLNRTFTELRYTRLQSDQCVYIRHTPDSVIIIAVHVDDMAIFGSDKRSIANAKNDLQTKYKITDLGEAKQIVGIEIDRDINAGTLKISQAQYITKVLKRFKMEESHTVRSPMDPNVKLIKTPDDEKYDIPDYAPAIGSLNFAACTTRPDIRHPTQALSQFMSNPNPTHWTAVKRVLRYLNGTRNYGITYGLGGEVEPIAYSDADWGANPNDRKSVSGNIFIMFGGPLLDIEEATDSCLIKYGSRIHGSQPSLAPSPMDAKHYGRTRNTLFRTDHPICR